MQLTLNQIRDYTKGSFVVAPISQENIATGITWDSRQVNRGDMYVALPGERVDGHSFVVQALNAGASGVLIMRPVERSAQVLASEFGAALIMVDDTMQALVDLGRAWRGHLKGRVIALTGSTGKTTTKNLVRDVVSASFSVVATQGNQNNELGVPKTILNASSDTDVIVVEMGMRGLGQIEELCEMVRPQWGLVTNVGESHIELLGSRENIGKAKGELLCGLAHMSGVGFVNAADDMTDYMVKYARMVDDDFSLVYFSVNADAQIEGQPLRESSFRAVWAQDCILDEQGCPRFVICARGFDTKSQETVDEKLFVQKKSCALSLRGMHNVSNACSAAAIGCALGMNLDDIVGALEASQPEAGRQEVLQARCGATVINDAYNANPDSMRASLLTFRALAAPGRHIAVLGDMGELGDFADECHERIGSLAGELSLDYLICMGDLSQKIATAACEAGMDPSLVVCVSSVQEVIEELNGYAGSGDAILIKASHFMGLERVVEGMVN